MPEHIKKKLEEEIRQMEHELQHELPQEIKKAAALGDLSENAEYHMAKQRQEFVNARLGQLKKRMAELSLVNLSNIPHDRIAFGSTVRVFDTTKDEEMEYKLVTSRRVRREQGTHLHHLTHRPFADRQAGGRHLHGGDPERQTRTRSAEAHHHP